MSDSAADSSLHGTLGCMSEFGFRGDEGAFRTYDGLPVAQDPPHGASVVVVSEAPEGWRYLLLHRVHAGPNFEGDWAWTPPAGARLPGEELIDCARRELEEETGLCGTPTPLRTGDTPWAVFELEVAWEPRIDLDREHDRYEWVAFDEACRKCLPDIVADSIRLAVR